MSDTPSAPANDPRADFLNASLWHGSLEAAEAILAAHPEIEGSDLYVSAVLGDDAAVRRYLAADPGNAAAKGGPRNWDALTYLCFSKYLRLDRSRSEGFVRAATALLDAGLSANTGFYEPGHQPRPEFESVLYGAAGVAHHPELTRLLLERGADPNDGEVVYHTPETMDNRAMQTLVGTGKLTPESMALLLARKFDWHDDEGSAWLLDNGADANLLTGWGGRPLHKALQCDSSPACFELLLDHGADPRLADQHGRTAYALAGRMARADVLELFGRRGFTVALAGEDAFLAACARADEATARALAAADPGLVGRMERQNPGLLADFAGSGNAIATRLLLDLGFHAGAARTAPRWREGETALHVATGRGRRECVKLLIERGAPLDARTRAGHTPLAVAILCLEKQSEWTPNDYTLGIARDLIEAGASVDEVGMTLAAAVCLGRPADVQRLGAEATARDRQVALAAAAYNGLSGAIPVLMALGADPNAQNEGLNPQATALHNAVCSGSLETVQRLVEAGARVDARDGWYQATPRDWADYFVREERGGTKQDKAIAAYLRDPERADVQPL